MKSTETTSGAWTARLLAALNAYGLDAASLCRAAGADARLLADPDARVPLQAWGKLWRAAEHAAADPYLGLHVGAAAPVDPLLVPGYALTAAPSLAEFMRSHLDLQRITFHADFFALREERDRSTVLFACAPGYTPSRHGVEYTAVILLRCFKQFFAVDPLRVTFMHPTPANAVEHARILGCAVHFARPENAFVLRRGDFERERLMFSESTFGHLRSAAEAMLDNVPLSTLRDRVRALLRQRLGRRAVDVVSVSHRLHVSTRTLQRRLAAEGTRFERILDAVRHEVAVEHVRRGAPLRQAAKAAGFAEPSSFCRAFRRWTGRTPEQFRDRGAR